VSTAAATLPAELIADRYGPRKFLRLLPATSVLLVLVGVSLYLCEASLGALFSGLAQGVEVLRFMFPPDWSAFGEMVGPALVTLFLALVATPLGVFVSIFFGLGAASNIAPPALRTVCRGLIATERALPEIVILVLLVAALGIGPVPGVFALAIGSIGMLGKLLADALEEVDPAVVDSVRSVGATRWQVIRYAYLPEVMPALIANSIFRFEINIRASVLLGAVGAGGIGYELSYAMAVLEYERATTAIIVTLLLVFGAERLSDFLRKRILKGERL